MERTLDGHDRTERWATSIVCALLVLLLLLTAVIWLRPDGPPVLGAWSGHDSENSVLYQFERNGIGVRTVEGVREPFRYEFVPGYPALMRLQFEEDAGAWRTALVELSDLTLRLEWGEPGGAPPRQMTAGALVLRTPALP